MFQYYQKLLEPHRSLSVVKLKCDHYDDKHGILGVSRVQKEIRMRKPTARGAKQAARTRTPPGQECGDGDERPHKQQALIPVKEEYAQWC